MCVYNAEHNLAKNRGFSLMPACLPACLLNILKAKSSQKRFNNNKKKIY
jgi:hypothetical protein